MFVGACLLTGAYGPTDQAFLSVFCFSLFFYGAFIGLLLFAFLPSSFPGRSSASPSSSTARLFFEGKPSPPPRLPSAPPICGGSGTGAGTALLGCPTQVPPLPVACCSRWRWRRVPAGLLLCGGAGRRGPGAPQAAWRDGGADFLSAGLGALLCTHVCVLRAAVRGPPKEQVHVLLLASLTRGALAVGMVVLQRNVQPGGLGAWINVPCISGCIAPLCAYAELRAAHAAR